MASATTELIDFSGIDNTSIVGLTTASNDGPVSVLKILQFGPPSISPVITNVNSSQTDGTYTVGEIINITITFDQAVDVTGTPQLTLETGTTDRVIDYASGSGSNTLTFNYTVQAGDTSADLDYHDTAALVLNGGTINTAGDSTVADLTLATPGTANSLGANKALVINTNIPTVSSVAISSATGIQNNTLNAGDIVNITVTMSEATVVTGTPQLALNIGGTFVNANYASGSGSTALVFSYTIANGQNDSNGIGIASNSINLNGGSLASALGNAADLTHSTVVDNSNYLVDTSKPTTPAAPALDPGSDTGISSADGITNLNTPTFSGNTEAFATINLYDTGGMQLLATTTADNSGNWSITVNQDPATGLPLANTHSVSVKAVDLAGNVSNASNNTNIVIDTTAPALARAITISDTALKVGDTATVTFIFTEAVVNFSTADLHVENGRITGLVSSDSGLTWRGTLTANTNVNNTTNIIVLDNTGVADKAGNIGVGTSNSPNYSIDTVRPTLASAITISDTALKTGDAATITFNFTEAITGFTAADLIAPNAVVTNLTTGDGGITWTARLTPNANASNNNNVITLDYTGITDLNGNPGTGSATSLNYSVDTVSPSATILVAKTSMSTAETSLVTITFNEAVTGFSNANLTVANGTLTPVFSSDGGITWTATLTPTAGVVAATNLITLNNVGISDAAGNAGTGSSNSNNYALTGSITGNNVAPVIGGTVAGQTVLEGASVSPFTGVTITDPDVGASETVIITPDLAAKGAFTAASLAATGFSTANGGITYTHAADTPAAIQAAIRGLVFQPAAGRVPVGGTETTTFTISANDGIASAVLNNTTTVIATGVNRAPTDISLAPASINQGSPANTTVGTLSATDPNPGDTASFVLATGNGSNDRDNSKFSISGNSLVAKNPLTMTPGNYTVLVRAIDGSGAAFDKSLTISIGDNVPPTVTAITRINPENSNLGTVLYSVTFSETVTGVTPAAFALALTGTANANIGSVTQVNGNTYTVQLNNVVGDGSLALNLNASGTGIVDTASLPLNGGLTGQVYQVDHTAPVVTVKNLNFFNDDGISATDYITTISQQTISGSLSAALPAGETVQVSLDNGVSWNNASTTGNNWTLGSQNLTGNNTLLARVIDLAGNTGSVLSQAYRIVGETSDSGSGNVNPNTNVKDIPTDGGNILPSIESQVPNLNGTAKGDGNGDNIPDQTQGDVSSLLWNNGSLVAGHYVTIANQQHLTQTHVETSNSPAALPADLRLPYGTLHTELTGFTAGKEVSFSLYTDELAPVNGYWVQNKAGDWVNIATNILSANGKLKVDFKITDGGIGDLDGKADGTISFSGALGFKSIIPINPNTSLPGDKDGDGIPDAVEARVGTNALLKDNDVLHRSDLFAMQLYRDVLFREADTAGLQYWQQQIDTGKMTRAQVAASFMASPEFQGGVGEITRLYFGAFDRLPDRDGLAYWMGQQKAGMSFNQISASFVVSEEFQKTYGSLDNTNFVERVYQNVLHRSSDTAGKSYWVGQLNNGFSRGDLLASFTESTEFKANSQGKVALTLDYIGLLGHAPDQATFDALLAQGNTDVVSLIGQFLNSPEYLARFMPT